MALIAARERCEQNLWDNSTAEEKAARAVLKADHDFGWIECVESPLECGRSVATGWAEGVLDPCRIHDTSCLEPTQCWLGGCVKTIFSRTAICEWQNKVPRNVCDACPNDCDRALCVCKDCFAEFCAACGAPANIGDPLDPATASGILSTRDDCNLCCTTPVDVCHGCCFNRLTLGDLYCCPETPGSHQGGVCPQ